MAFSRFMSRVSFWVVAFQAISNVVVLLLLAASAIVMTVIKARIEQLTEELAVCLQETQQDDCYWEETVKWFVDSLGDSWAFFAIQNLSLVQAGVLALLNMTVRMVALKSASLERKHTHSAREKSIFYKMSFAFLVNSVLLPMIIYRDDASTWFNPGSVIEQALMLLLIDFGLTSTLRTLALPHWILQSLKRLYGRLRFKSQAKLQEMYAPKSLELGELYASMVLTFGLCMFYGPMAPVAYAIGGAAATLLAMAPAPHD